MEKLCDGCRSRRFRPSRFRLSDITRLLMFKLPVRCLSCQQRSYAWIPWVFEYHRKKRAKRP